MQYAKLRKGMKVQDVWFSYHDGTWSEPWGGGVVKKVLKTRVHIEFEFEGNVVYDIPHLQFVKRLS